MFAAWNLPAHGMTSKQTLPPEVGKAFKFALLSLDGLTKRFLGSRRCANRLCVLPEGNPLRREEGRASFPAPCILIPPKASSGAPEVRTKTTDSLGQWLTVRLHMLRDKGNKLHPGKGVWMWGGWQTANRPPLSGGKSGVGLVLQTPQGHSDGAKGKDACSLP